MCLEKQVGDKVMLTISKEDLHHRVLQSVESFSFCVLSGFSISVFCFIFAIEYHWLSIAGIVILFTTFAWVIYKYYKRTQTPFWLTYVKEHDLWEKIDNNSDHIDITVRSNLIPFRGDKKKCTRGEMR